MMWAGAAVAEDLRGAILIMQLAAAVDVVLETEIPTLKLQFGPSATF